eukprot:CAMPEP_0114547286 /NCGR_PEP_ID=MMETSP0114-20121206/4384_1 /TAXON_ID=31324 /ORGANISM="Goniomonas sp, Strain m" /LENGTH=370 /DNA_ID=CAMNT_0001731833 /DNA_START=31 /DNA_END=1143 /DNA_ORIENTATION=-
MATPKKRVHAPPGLPSLDVMLDGPVPRSTDSSPPTVRRMEPSTEPSTISAAVPQIPFEPQIVTIDLRVQASKNGGLGLVPLKHSLKELAAFQDNDKRKFSDGADWLNRFFFAKDGGLPIIRVDPMGFAHEAGVRACDVIVAVNMMDVRNKSALKTAQKIRKTDGPTMMLSVLRCVNLPYDPETAGILAEQNNKPRSSSYTVSLAIKCSEGSTSFGFIPLKYSFADKSLAPKSQKYLFTMMKNRCPFATGIGGLPVQMVDSDGPAARAGLQAWDVITSVNGINVCQLRAAEVSNHIRAQPGGELTLSVLRSTDPINSTETAPSPIQRAISNLHRWSSFRGDQKLGQRADVGEDGVIVADVMGLENHAPSPY